MSRMLRHIHAHIIPAAYTLLPAPMRSDRATAMLLAIGLQESRFKYRRQTGGPARGFWQFERGGGVKGVLTHRATQQHIDSVLNVLRYQNRTAACYAALADNDVLAACFARLLLWTLPQQLPDSSGEDRGWQQYRDAWQPGKPHPETWNACYRAAWDIVSEHYSHTDVGSEIPGGGAL